jgi:hypothetical protein
MLQPVVNQYFMPINFEKLMSRNPFEYDRMLNSKGQVILFLESPTRGDEAPVICACPELGLAAYSCFFETDDMMADHGEYEPWFSEKGTLKFGELGDPNE